MVKSTFLGRFRPVPDLHYLVVTGWRVFYGSFSCCTEAWRCAPGWIAYFECGQHGAKRCTGSCSPHDLRNACSSGTRFYRSSISITIKTGWTGE